MRHRGDVVMLALAAFFTVGLVINANHLYYNSTPSEPVGEYWLSDGAVHRGDVVLLCMSPAMLEYAQRHKFGEPSDSASPCWHHTTPFLKEVTGITGDRVHTDSRGVTINGTLLPNTMPIATSDDGTPIPIARDYIVPDGEIVAISTATYSFDSRYAGPLKPLHLASLLLKDPFIHGAAADARTQRETASR